MRFMAAPLTGVSVQRRAAIVGFCTFGLLSVGPSSSEPISAQTYAASAPIVDHHQHIFSLATAKRWNTDPITAAQLIAHLDAAGIKRAVVLSSAFIWEDAPQLRAENDWISQQVAQFPDRLTGLCGINPLKEYALDELAHCAQDAHLRTGVKLHAASNGFDYHDADHIERLRRLFRAANGYGMAIVIHMHPHAGHAYGPEEVRLFLNELVSQAPDVSIQVAHMAGSALSPEGEAPADALSTFVEAIKKKDPRTKRLLFDLTIVAVKDTTPDQAKLIAQRVRQVGIERIVYGSDAAMEGYHTPREGWSYFRKVPLTEDDFRTIIDNVAPYVRR